MRHSDPGFLKKSGFLVLQFLSITMKIAFASLLVGAGLSVFDVTAVEVLGKLGLTPQNVYDILTKGLTWAVPNIVLGSMIIVPLWIVVMMLRPPRG